MVHRGQELLIAAAVLLGSALVGADAAVAVSITNRDDKDHKITLVEDEGAVKVDHTLKPNQVLEGVCEKGCVLRLNDSEERVSARSQRCRLRRGR